LPTDKPLTLASYSAGNTLTAYVEPLGAGEVLPDMPLFLTNDRYVLCRPEAAYQASWDEYPPLLRKLLLDPPDPAT
jgi:hypothetical protein